MFNKQISILRFIAFSLALCASLFASVSRADGVVGSRRSRLLDAQSFVMATGAGNLDGDYQERLGKFDVVIVDAEEISRAKVRELRRQGALVIGFVAIGTIEPWRWWAKETKGMRLEFLPAGDEWVADLRSVKYRKLMLSRVMPWVFSKDFDGIMIDHLDVLETRPWLTAGTLEMVKALRTYTAKRGALLLAQNGDKVINKFARYLDGWHKESLATDYCFETFEHVVRGVGEVKASLNLLRVLKAKGLFTAVTEYIDPTDVAVTGSAFDAACSVGALSYYTDLERTDISETPFYCSTDNLTKE